jgi:hypothetical protein
MSEILDPLDEIRLAITQPRLEDTPHETVYDVLCETCKDFFSGIVNLDEDYERAHHNGQGLIDAAESCCHLCTMVLTSFNIPKPPGVCMEQDREKSSEPPDFRIRQIQARYLGTSRSEPPEQRLLIFDAMPLDGQIRTAVMLYVENFQRGLVLRYLPALFRAHFLNRRCPVRSVAELLHPIQ